MSKRPDFIDLRSASSNDLPRPNVHLGDLPSPRTGEVPPALSPLDAFAMASRMLAKRFEEKQTNGRRISRLPHLDIANEFGRPRPGFSRADSGGMGSPMSVQSEPRADRGESRSDAIPSGLSPTLASQQIRPISQYPLLQNQPEQQKRLVRQNTAPSSSNTTPPVDYFDLPRSSSPEAIDPRYVVQQATPPSEAGQQSGDSYTSLPLRQRGLTSSTTSTRGTGPVRLAPTYSPQARPARSTSSIRSVPQDSGDDYDNRSISDSDYFRPRKLSGSSAFSGSQPQSPYTGATQRPPSVNSEYSIGGTRVPRGGINFSRPISRSGMNKPTTMDTPLRQGSNASSYTRPSLETMPSTDTRPSVDSPLRQDSGTGSATSHLDQNVQTPMSNASVDDYFAGGGPAPSYIYAKYSLPRGRTVERDSVNHLRNSWLHHFQFDAANVETQSVPSTPIGRAYSPHPIPVQLQAGINPIRSQSADDHAAFPPRRSSHRTNPSAPSVTAPSVSSTSTVKPHTHGSRPAAADLTPQEHLDKGIQLHSDGFLKESTYHLRLAAHAGLPTAMLLYALACRHGWGMRPSQEEGVRWLRKAVDSASLEVADDTALSSGTATDYTESKTRKAQFALSIYELGVSYMNGWGIAQDRSLALRCFEIAGSWGDVDALAEAGFCYTEGVGCRKDLKKAARFYRMAEARGMSMAGNSWIYKDKYMDDPPERQGRGRGRSVSKKEIKEKEKKPREKSRTRGLFSRRKHAGTPEPPPPAMGQ